MQARFDFAGTLIPPTEDLPTHLGLHHHGEEPEVSRQQVREQKTSQLTFFSFLSSDVKVTWNCTVALNVIIAAYFVHVYQRAGYSLQELFLLSRSQVIQQRSLALSTLANILSKVCSQTPTASLISAEALIWTSFSSQARGGEYVSVLTGSVLSTLLDAGLLFLLRFALDDSVERVMSAAVHALKALLVCAEDEVRQNCDTFKLDNEMCTWLLFNFRSPTVVYLYSNWFESRINIEQLYIQ